MDELRYGFFDEPVGPIEPDTFELRSPMGEILGIDERRDAFRQFQFLGAVSDDVVVGCALTQSKLLTSGFVYVCTMSDRQLVQLRLRVDDRDEFTLSRDPDHGNNVLSSDRGDVVMTADGSSKKLVVNSDVMTIDLEIDETGFDTQRICTRTGPTGFAYAQKVAGVPARGHVETESHIFDLGAVDASGHHDFTAGFLRPETWWHWACLSAVTSDGRRIGLNLSCGTNETSYTENCVWVEGQIHRVGGTVFEFDPDDWDRPWTVRTVDDTVDLRFDPAHGYHATGEAGPVASNFHQLFGTFTGSMRGPAGESIAIDQLAGFAETQFLRW